MQISDLNEVHLNKAYELWLKSGWNESYQINKKEFIQSWENAYIKKGIIRQDQVIAIGRANSDGVLYSMIHDIVVDPLYRNQGLGQAMVLQLVDELKSKNIRCIQLMAAKKQVGFYQSLGFEPRPEDAPGMQWRGI